MKYPNTGGAPRFDFRINQNSDCDYIIEFDGEQHFREIPMYDSTDTYMIRQLHDKFKNDWCRENNIPLIRIPFKRLKKLCFDDLLPDKSEFLVA